MKQGRNRKGKITFHKVSTIVSAVMVTLVIAGCTKQRDASFPDDAGETVYELQMIRDAEVQVLTSGAAAVIDRGQALRAGGEAAAVKVVQFDSPPLLAPMFEDLTIVGIPGAAYNLRFRVDKKFITAYKIVTDSSDLTILEAQIAQKYTEFAGALAVPLFMYPIDTYGVVVRTKNDLNEETSALKLKETEWEEATHVRALLFSSRRVAVKAPASQTDVADRVFVKERINELVLSRKDLAALVDIRIGGSSGDTQSAADAGLYQMQVSGTQLNILEVTTLDSKSVTDEMRELLRSQKCEAGRCPIAKCSEKTLAQLEPSFPKDRCVTIVRFATNIRFVVATQPEVEEGIVAPELEFREPLAGDDQRLVQIAKNPQLEEKNPVDQIAYLDPTRALPTAQLRSKEFLFRRTLEDSPNGFDFTFAGAAGNLEIVTFEFLSDRVQVRRADAIIDAGTGSDVDVETLISIPARYVRQELTDVNGNPLQVPRFVQTTHEDANGIAIVDWTQNAIPNVSSALDYYGLEQCFTGARERLVSEVDQRLREGLLHFTLATTYSSSPTTDCAGIGRAGYFDVVQTTFTFKERFSFKAYEKKGEEKPLLAVPYEAQKRMGFGLFTYSKQVPDQFGNVGDDGTVIPLPAIFDLSDERQITYVLAGLPQKDPERSAIIRATREVIADWNAAFKRAFKGTNKERSKEVLVLKIEGEDVAPGKLGDLDRNYIYYVQKRTKSRVIGLGGAHANPRTGEVEAASVFLYGGNILGVVDSIRKVDAAKKLYQEQVLASLAAVEDAENSSDAAGANGANTNSVAATDTSAVSNTATNGASDGSALSRHPAILQPRSAPDLLHAKPAQLSSQQRQDLEFYGNLMQRLRGDLSQAREEAVSAISRNAESKALYEAYRRSVHEGSLQDRDRVAAHFNRAILAASGSRLTAAEKRKLQGTANRDEAMSRVLRGLRSANICAYEADDSLFLLSGAAGVGEQSDLELAMAIYKPTLAHEIGHNLGLRHNFIASFDGEHHKFDGESETKRNYSSVMDYMPDDHETYSGLGPQDVAAIRAAYAQLVEVDPAIQEQLPPQIGEVKIVDGKFIPIESYRELLGLSSWLQLNAAAMSRLPLRNYLFCSDEDAGTYPTCNRFDTGASADAIVQAVVDDHRALYSIRNFAGDRIDFGYSGTGSYIGRLFGKLTPLRQFLEETIYLLITGGSSDAVNAHAQATFGTMNFLHEIVRSPDAPSSRADGGRFVAVAQEEGPPVVVERKSLSDLAFDINSDRLSVRGVEFDKVIALLLLTERSLGFPRYERVSLRFSFPEFEQLVFGSQVQSPLQLPTIGLLTEIIENRISPMAPGRGGNVLPLSGQFVASTTDQMRFFAVLGAIANLDVDGLEAKDNVSSLFRVMSNFTAPSGVPSLLRPGVNESNRSELRYWAFDGALATDQVVAKGRMLAAVNSKSAALLPLLQSWTKLLFLDAPAGEGEISEEAGSELERVEQALAAELATLPDSVGPKDLPSIANFLGQVIGLTEAVQAQGDRVMPMDQYRTLLQNIAKDAPVFGLAIQALPAQELGLTSLVGVIGDNLLAVEELTIYRNTQSLNTLFYNLHPEFRR